MSYFPGNSQVLIATEPQYTIEYDFNIISKPWVKELKLGYWSLASRQDQK